MEWMLQRNRRDETDEKVKEEWTLDPVTSKL